MKKLQLVPKHHENSCTCTILMFTYLMTSKLWLQNARLEVDAIQFLKSKRRYLSMTESKDEVTLINSLYFEFRSVNLPKHKPNIKRTIKIICPEAFSYIFAQKIIIKASTTEFISSKFLCSQEQQTMIEVVSQPGLIRRILQFCMPFFLHAGFGVGVK